MNREWLRAVRGAAIAAFVLLPCAAFADGPQATPSIFAPASTPATDIVHLALFALSVVGGIFVVVGGLLTYVVIRYRDRHPEDPQEPAQVFGSNQIELAWTVIPILIVVVLFLTTARMIFAIQDHPKPPSALNVTVVGHQFWWEYRYPNLGIVTANELHVPLSSDTAPKPTYLKLLSADVVHSFWVPQLAGKTDVIPNSPNLTWIDPKHPGLYLGQCAQFCGIEHAKMLIRVYVDTPQQFAAWVKNQQQPAVQDPSVVAGRHVFETQACMNCHTIRGTVATGRFGPDLTHLMSRDTIASGAVPLTKANLRQWIEDPDSFKPGALMPAMKLSDQQLDELTDYLSTLK
ncbi:MAG: cytochrome c oxidase subunit II [Acidobacteriaceae bacterium]